MRIKIDSGRRTFCPNMLCKHNISGHCDSHYRPDNFKCVYIEEKQRKKHYWNN